MIRFSHSVFALPFALTSAALAGAARAGSPRGRSSGSWWRWSAARSAAMGFNRLADHEIDARNPRTAARELPRGRPARAREVWAFVRRLGGASSCSPPRMLNPLCLALSPVALAIVFGYSYTKRFTPASPPGARALAGASRRSARGSRSAGRFDAVPLVLGLAVVLWVAGFDMIYACQDVDFDRRAGLHSIPARLGVPRRPRRGPRAARRGRAAAARACTGSPRCTRSTWPGWRWWRRSSPTSTRSCGPTTCAAWTQAFNLNGWVSLGYFAFTAAAAWLA